MRRVTYNDLELEWTPTATTFPSIANLTADINQLYYQAEDIRSGAESLAITYSIIKAKVENHAEETRRKSQYPVNWSQERKPLIFTDAERLLILGSSVNTDFTIDSASKSEYGT